MTEIKDINDDRIAYYKSLRYTPTSHTEDKVFVAEGAKVTERLLRSDISIVSIFAVPEYYEKFKDLIEAKKIQPDRQFTASKKLMESIVGFNLHAGIMAIGKKPEESGIDGLSDRVVVLNRIIDAENVGSIIRNSAAFGIDSIVVDNESSDPYLRRAVRVSMGNVFGMKIHYSKNLKETLEYIKSNTDYRIIGAEITGDSKDITNYSFPGKYLHIFGSEGHGIANDILALCDDVVHIPMSEGVPSINVAASTAVFLYAATLVSNEKN